MFFWHPLTFSVIQWMLAIWSLVLLPFLNPAWTPGSSWFHVLLRFGLLNFEHYLASVWDQCNCVVVWILWHWLFFGIRMKTDLFQSCGHCWVFQICWHIECSTFTASSLKELMWNSSPPLVLFVLMLPKACLTFHSKMSGSRWMIPLSRLSGSWRSFLYSSSVYSCTSSLYLLLLLGPYHSCLCAQLFMKSSHDISNFL